MAKKQNEISGRTKSEVSSKKSDQTKKNATTSPVANAKQKSNENQKGITAKVDSKGGQFKGAVASAKGMASTATRTTGKQTKSRKDLEVAEEE